MSCFGNKPPLLMPENKSAKDSLPTSSAVWTMVPVLTLPTHTRNCAKSYRKSALVQHQRCLLFKPLWLLHQYTLLRTIGTHIIRKILLRNGPKVPYFHRVKMAPYIYPIYTLYTLYTQVDSSTARGKFIQTRLYIIMQLPPSLTIIPSANEKWSV